MLDEIFTIGHSALEYERFLALLRGIEITAIADVRSSPFSRHLPHFNRDNLQKELRSDGISYVFLGQELGGRPKKLEYYRDGIADYDKMADDEEFKLGLERLVRGMQKYRIALMCSEHHPMDCHRCLLVGRSLVERSIPVRHVLSDGQTISQGEIEQSLIDECGHGGDDMFAKGRARLAEAYRERARQVSYRKPTAQPNLVAAEYND